jgi:hypothetical protein
VCSSSLTGPKAPREGVDSPPFTGPKASRAGVGSSSLTGPKASRKGIGSSSLTGPKAPREGVDSPSFTGPKASRVRVGLSLTGPKESRAGVGASPGKGLKKYINTNSYRNYKTVDPLTVCSGIKLLERLIVTTIGSVHTDEVSALFNSFFHATIRDWNQLHQLIKDKPSLASFKSALLKSNELTPTTPQWFNTGPRYPNIILSQHDAILTVFKSQHLSALPSVTII